MLNKLRKVVSGYSTNLSLLIKLSPAERTRLSWAKHIETYEDVPGCFQSFFEPYQTSGKTLPYTILTPSYEGFRYRELEKLVCLFERHLTVLIRNGAAFDQQEYPLDRIEQIEVRTVLLDSHINIHGEDAQGNPISTTIRFNTITDYLFRPVLERIRQSWFPILEVNNDTSDVVSFDQWAVTHFKFATFARKILLSKEPVIHAILQPKILIKRFNLPGRLFHRTITPAHMILLTDRELILFREEVRTSIDDHYGGIWDYLPLKNITCISLSEADVNFQRLSIQMKNGTVLERFHENVFKGSLECLITYIQGNTKGKMVHSQ